MHVENYADQWINPPPPPNLSIFKYLQFYQKGAVMKAFLGVNTFGRDIRAHLFFCKNSENC
jgi:hypothetical protein